MNVYVLLLTITLIREVWEGWGKVKHDDDKESEEIIVVYHKVGKNDRGSFSPCSTPPPPVIGALIHTLLCEWNSFLLCNALTNKIPYTKILTIFIFMHFSCALVLPPFR